MPCSIDFREIPIFAYFGSDARKALAAVFSRQIRNEGETIIAFGRPVPGISIIVEGEVHIKLPHITEPVATLSRGQCCGEMSLLGESAEDASADVVVSSPTAKLLFCSIADFHQILVQIPDSAPAFYRGSAVQLASRLRLFNQRLDQVLEIGQGMLSKVIQSSEVEKKISVTKSALDSTGESVVNKLMEIMPYFDALIHEHPATKPQIDILRERIENVFLVDAQNFDRISQQLNQIQQHFENMRRLTNGGTIVPIVGDRNIF
ncbi:MAG: cyclic nucleotide-binding domain-containing protein [Chitinophagaceae bacterium]|nr:cyclic nucleotide-binding domain-containing protein [Oligoflexus sp.]